LAVTARCPHCRGQLELSAVGTRWQARRPSDVADRLIAQLGSLEREELHVLLLDTRCGVMAQERVYQGNVSSSLVRVGELFTAAVRRNATAILLVHSHPSGDPTPSPDDLRLTAEAVAAGRLLDIALLDHLIIAGSAYVSLRERGVAFGDPGDHHARPSWPTESAAPARLRLENGGQQ
jgi:DNA repair protein RadC